MTEVAAATSVSDRYDSSLSYEERARLRRKRRQETKAQMSLDISSPKSASSIDRSHSPTAPYHSDSSPTSTPRYHASPTGSVAVVQNGLFRPVSPLVGSKKNYHSFDSGVSVSNGTDVSGSSSIIVKSREQPGKPRGILKKRLNSEPPGSVSSHSKPTPVQVPLAESRVHPVISASGKEIIPRPRAHSNNTVLDQPHVGGKLGGTTHTRSCSPQSPHSPIVKRLASLHLAGVIERQQHRESSCSPSPRTPTSKQQAKSRERVFSFPDVQDKDNTANGSSSGETESTLTPLKVSSAKNREAKTTKAHIHSARVEVVYGKGVPTTNGKFETPKTVDSADVFDDADGASLSRHSGSNSNVSTSSSFTYESFEWHNRRGGSNPPDPPPNVQQPKSFAEGLKFFDTTDSKSGSVNTSVEKDALVMKTNVVYRPIDEMNDEDITVIPRGVFFDPSQSQLDAYPERFPPMPVYGMFGAGQANKVVKEECPMNGEALEGVKKEKKTSKSKSKELKSPLRIFKKNSASTVLDEESPDSAEAVVNDGGVTPKIKKKYSSKKSPLKKKRSVSESQVNKSPAKTNSSSKIRIHSSSQITPTHSKPPLPNSGDHSNKSTPTHMLSSKPPLPTALSRPYSSFREDKVKSPESSSGLSKISMPDLSSPSSRGTTPDASSSSTCMSPENETKSSGKKTKSSIRQRITISMRGLMGRDSSPGASSPVVLKGFRKLDADSFASPTTSLIDSSGLTSASSESQLSALTEHDLNTMLEDTEMIPRTYSLECILPKYEERGIDVFPTDERKGEEEKKKEDKSTTNNESSDSDSEYHTASESESFSEKATESTRSTSDVLITSESYDGEDHEVDSRLKEQLTSKSESALTQKSSVQRLISPVMNVTDKKLPSTKSPKLETQKLKTARSPKRVSSLKETSSSVTAAKQSAISSSKRVLNTKDSPSRSSLKSTKPSSLRKPTGRTSPLKSPVSTKKSITKPTSPSPARKSPNTASHSASPLSTRKLKGSPVTSPLSSRSTSPAKKATTQTSPLSKKKVSPSKVGLSPTSMRRATPTKSSSSTSPSPRSSQRSKAGTKHAPPMLSKSSLESSSGTDLTPGTPPTFSRFARGRVPIKLRSASVGDHSPESLAERVQRIKEQRKSHQLPVHDPTTKSASNPCTPATVKKRPSSPLNLSAVSRSSHSSLSSTPSTPSSDKKRRIGVSLEESPVHIEKRLSGAGLKLKETDKEETITETAKDLSALSLNVDMLLSSVGEELDSMELFPTSPPHNKPTTFEAVTSQESDLGPSPVLVHVTDEPSPEAPDIAKMPFSVFSPSSLHSRESSFDFDNEPRSTTSSEPVYNHLEPIYYDHLAPKEEEEQTPPEAYVTPESSPLLSKREASKKELASKKSPLASKKSLLATKKSASVSSPRSSKKVNVSSPVSSKKVTSTKTATSSGKFGVPNQRMDLLSKSGSKHLSPVLEKKEREDQKEFAEKKRSPLFFKKRGSAPVVKGISTAKSDSKLGTKQAAFTSALPPKPPSMRKIHSEVHTAASKRVSSADKPSTSSTGQTRPRNFVVARPSSAAASPLRSSMRKSTPSSATPLSVSTNASGGDLKSKSSVSLFSGGVANRSGIRASARSKRTSVSAHTTPIHRVQSGGTTLAPSNVSVRKSMRSKSTHIRPNSASTLPRRGSAGATTLRASIASSGSSLSQGSATRGSSTLVSPARRSMKRANSGDLHPRKIKPGASATLNRERKTSRDTSSVYASMRRVSTAVNRPSSASTSTLKRSSATMSMRHSSSSRSSSSISHKPSAQLSSPSRSRGGTLKRTSSAGEVLAAFDHISAQAQGSLLTGSDHRRNVRPKMRQKASSSHLKMLRQRKDVSTELIQSDDSSPSMVDLNTYSTYMAKKNLDPTAIAGLAAKLDFTTVKLRKTGIVEQMLSEESGGTTVDNRIEPPGMEYNTQHSVMLLQVKGRRYIQTRLVKPCSASLNSGDVFIALTNKQLFHWVGKSANVIEKARGSDVVMRILHKKELSCHATSVAVFKEEDNAINRNSKKYNAFWDLLGGNDGVKSSESVPSDELFEKAVNLATMVYQLEGDKEKIQFIPIHENTSHMVKVSLLHSTLILLFDFVSEVYLWVGRQSPPAMRKKALELAKAMFDSGCKQPVFNLRSSPARASGRYRPKSAGKSPRHSVVNSSGRRTSRVSKSDMKPRPEWALFARVVEGAESILFREKFSDWPEPGRIIKMKGHASSGITPKFTPTAELRPADVEKMLKPTPAFEGLRLEGENIHRGQGNYKVSRSTFACNRVRTGTITKWVVKEFDNVTVNEKDHGIFYESEAYVIRWAFLITVVRELEGIVPGQGMFARDRQYQKSLLAKAKRDAAPEAAIAEEVKKAKKEDSDSECSDVESDDETKRILESGGRDKVAYFFWQGESATVNEKGASALMTIELDKERGPQVRVTQNKEPPAFLNLFNGGMIILKGRSETNSLQSTDRHCRVFCIRTSVKSEGCLREITPEDEKRPLSSLLRSRGCFVFYYIPAKKVYLWQGSKSTHSLKKASSKATKLLRNRLGVVELIPVQEGEEPNDFCALVGDNKHYLSMAKETRLHDFTPRLFELTSTTGEFVASEVINTARSGDTEAFPFLQSDIYSAIQPAIFLLDAQYEVYVWLGWWPQEKNKLLKEHNATTGSAHARWLRDKKLALETAQHYVKACNRTRTPRAYMVAAGTEHEKFINIFPFWEVSQSVLEINCKGITKPTSRRVDSEDELAKYSRTRFTLEELSKRPVPEGVDPSKLETYLSDEEFKRVFKVTKEQFVAAPLWRQTDLKKRVGLF